MARFIEHTSCERCGSSDAKALYDDGSSYCFSCRGVSSDLRLRIHGGRREERRHFLPSDVTSVITGSGWDWVSKYGLSAEQLCKNNVVYSPSRQQVIFTWPECPSLWSTRNFWTGATSKSNTYGELNESLPIYWQPQDNLPDTIVVVEDCLSSIKCSYTGRDSMPCLGSSIPTKKLVRLSRRYDRLVVWLDHDKGLEAQKIARKAYMLGMRTKVVHTELDPKEHTYEQIKELCDTKTST